MPCLQQLTWLWCGMVCLQAAAGGGEPSDAIRAVNALLTQLDQLRRFPNVMVLTTSNITEAIDVAFVDRADIKVGWCFGGEGEQRLMPQAVVVQTVHCALAIGWEGLSFSKKPSRQYACSSNAGTSTGPNQGSMLAAAAASEALLWPSQGGMLAAAVPGRLDHSLNRL